MRSSTASRLCRRAAAFALRLRVATACCGSGLPTQDGVSPKLGPGAGLANIEIRLAALFGPAGTLSLDQNDFGGVTATLEMPLRMASVERQRSDDLVIA